jgi:choline kinase
METTLIGMVLAAGAGRRLRPDTDGLPKALLPVDGDVTILDIALRNLAAVGLRDVTVVVGYAAGEVRDRVPALEAAHGVRLRLVDNDRAEEWNNAYSLWLAREHFAAGALLVNGDTVHPVSVEQTLLAAAGQAGIVLALDDVKSLADEEMKVILGPDGRLAKITKLMDPAQAHGEYIGATLINRPPPPRWPTRSRRPGAAIPRCTTRTATRNSPTAAGSSRPLPSGRSTGSRWTTMTTCAGPASSSRPCAARKQSVPPVKQSVPSVNQPVPFAELAPYITR